ncbi:MAG TPA: hypothetical protein VI197_18860, partial [Polyangiaceae bacterium]
AAKGGIAQASWGGDPPAPPVPLPVVEPPALTSVVELPVPPLAPELTPNVVAVAPPTLLLAPVSIPPTVAAEEAETAFVAGPVAEKPAVVDTAADELAFIALVVAPTEFSGGSAAVPQPAPAIPSSQKWER